MCVCVLCMDVSYVLNVFGNLLLFKCHLHIFIHAVTPNKIADFILRNQNEERIQEKFYYSVKDATLTRSTIRLDATTEIIPSEGKGKLFPLYSMVSFALNKILPFFKINPSSLSKLCLILLLLPFP